MVMSVNRYTSTDNDKGTMKRAFLSASILLLAVTAWAAQPADHIGATPVPPPRSSGHQIVPAGTRAIAWTTIDPLQPGAARVTGAACNGKIYKFGGQTNTGASDTVEIYNPATGVWSYGANMPIAAQNICCAVWRDRIYVIGGSPSYGDMQVYNADSNTWHTEARPADSIWGAAAAVVGDTLYVFGGAHGLVGTGTNFVHAYDLVGHTWSAKTAIPAATIYAAAVACRGKVYLVGGGTNSDLAVNYEYDPATDSWTAKAPMQTGRGGPGATEIGGKVYVFGGAWSSPYSNTVEVYDPLADTTGGTPWSYDTSFATPRRSHFAASLGNTAYVVGGWNSSNLASTERGQTDAPVVEDIVAQGIYLSPWVGNYGAVLHPYIGVGNYSPYRLHNVPVTLRIDSAGVTVYEHTQYYNMNGTSGYGYMMPDWRPCTTPGIAYNLSLITSYTGDQNAANDTSRITITVKDALWYQFDSTASQGGAAQNFETANDAYDCWIADDFSVDGVDSVRIDSVTVRGSYSTVPAPDSLSLVFTSDSTWSPAFSQTVAAAMVMGSDLADTNGTFTARLASPVVLPAAERYWLACQLHMSYTAGGQWYWTSTVGSLNASTATAVWMNPGDGFGTGYTHWTPTTTVWPGISNFSFILHGGAVASGVAGGPAPAGPRPDFSLAQVSPNPVRGGARFFFSLARGGDAKLDVYSLLGQKVASVASGRRDAGRHSVAWDGRGRDGRPVAAGLYFYRLTADGRSLTRKFVVVR
ncbi:T9SS type A sorting domain-containing protein [bacterium]|nr:T9SS type A sorting domain-containing protein [bacterium]